MKPIKTVSERDRIFLITDGCQWEKNKQDGTSFPHSIEVVDTENGQVRYIRGGSRIMFVDGAITQSRSQKFYNESPSLPRGKKV